MSEYFLLCNFTDQGIRHIKDMPNRRAAARDLAKTLGVEIKSAFMALGTHDLIVHVEAASDDIIAKFVLAIASKGNIRSQTVKVFSEAESDKIIGALG